MDLAGSVEASAERAHLEHCASEAIVSLKASRPLYELVNLPGLPSKEQAAEA